MLGFVSDAARSALKLLGGAEREVEQHTLIEQPVHEAIAALHHAAESMDRHVEVLEGVAATLPALTGALVKLTEQLGEVLHMAAPLEAAERDLAGIGHLFRRRRHSAPAPVQLPAATAAAAATTETPALEPGREPEALAEAVGAPAATAPDAEHPA